MAEITVAVVQTSPKLGNLEANLYGMADMVEQICSEEKVNLIVFPELATTGVENGVNFNRLAERVPGHQFNVLATKAADFSVHIVFGLPTKEKVESTFYNAAVVIGPDGDLLGEYRKVHLKGEEKLSFRPGYRFPVFDTGLGVLGLMIGWDLAFPEAARSLVLSGAEILCVPAAYEEPQQEEWRAFCLARAAENGVFVVAANRVGEEPSRRYFGESCIIGPDGGALRRLVDPNAAAPAAGYTIASFDTDAVRRYREEQQIIMSRQPSAYSAVVKKY
ncbi:MAG: carbon-nitrogen hydrolase family protein [Caldilineales bacterium]|nr:carbon-nitrogen hydrolase family protein [Caldilineales bacterium]MCW5858100.1 carbon-nitrogen hydrolase family protein [Caldilineales bacterium]